MQSNVPAGDYHPKVSDSGVHVPVQTQVKFPVLLQKW